MAKRIKLGGGMTHIVPLHNHSDRSYAIVVDGFATPLVLELSETAIARIENGQFDIDISWGLSNLIDTAIANTDLVLATDKYVTVEERAVSTVDLVLSAEKSVAPEPIGAVARDKLISFAYSIELDDSEITCVAHSELGEVVLMRYRFMVDDADCMMSDDSGLSLDELYRIEEMR
jgi:hypothetical protein